MTPKSEPVSMLEARRAEIEEECSSLDNDSDWFPADAARIAAYVDAKVREFAEELLANMKFADDPFRDQIELNALNVFRGWTLALAHLHGVEIDYDKATERVEATLHKFTACKVKEALEDACDAICDGCAIRAPTETRDGRVTESAKVLIHPGWGDCKATHIRALLAKKVKP